MPDQNFKYRMVDAKGKSLKPIACQELDLNLPWIALILHTNSLPKAFRRLRLTSRAH
jgi:hypothetical protein